MSDSLPKQKKLVSISEAAKFLGVSIDTVRRWDKSGDLHSERPDGKNRYFSLDELEKHKSGQPLPISEVAKRLGISPTTLRRLEARGSINPKRNNAGERVYDKDLITNFLNSDYFLRKKQDKDKILESFQEEKEIIEDLSFESDTQPLETIELAGNPENSPPEIPSEFFKNINLDLDLKLQKRIPEILAASVIFILLLSIGITNIKASGEKSLNPPLTPPVLSKTIEIKPEVLGTVTINDGTAIVNIREKPSINSKKVGEAKNGDIFVLVSEDNMWFGVKLAHGSKGYILVQNIKKGESSN